MSETAIAVVAKVAAELRDLPRDAILDVAERVHRDQRFAGQLERAVEALRATPASGGDRPPVPRSARLRVTRHVQRIGRRDVTVVSRAAAP